MPDAPSNPSEHHDNLVSRARGTTPLARFAPHVGRWLWVAGVAAVAGAAALAPTRRTRGVFVVALVMVVLGGAIEWLAKTGPTLSESGQQMKDWGKW